MELRQLRHLVAAVEHGTISRAAEAMHITQPGLTRSIRNLEAVFGAPLLERTARGVRPTPLGAALVERAHAILNDSERVLRELRDRRSSELRHCRIGVTSSFVSFVSAEAIRRVRQRRPDATVAVIDGFSAALIGRLRRGEIDLFFGFFTPEGNAEDLAYEELFTTRSAVFASRSHPLAGRTRVTAEELGRAEWAVPHQIAMSSVLDRYFEALQIREPRIAVRASSMTFMREAVLKLGLLAVLPELMMQAECRTGEAVELRTSPAPGDGAPVGLVRRAGVPLTPVGALVAAAFREEVGKLVRRRVLRRGRTETRPKA